MRECVRGAAPWPLLVHGEPGRGKTCAALALLDHAGGLFASASGLCEWVNAATFGRLSWSTIQLDNSGNPDVTRLWTVLARTPLFVLDDLGARKTVTDGQYDCVKRLLDEREGSPLVVLSNLSIAALAGVYDDRVASRLGGGTVLELVGDDRRLSGRAAEMG